MHSFSSLFLFLPFFHPSLTTFFSPLTLSFLRFSPFICLYLFPSHRYHLPLIFSPISSLLSSVTKLQRDGFFQQHSFDEDCPKRKAYQEKRFKSTQGRLDGPFYEQRFHGPYFLSLSPSLSLPLSLHPHFFHPYPPYLFIAFSHSGSSLFRSLHHIPSTTLFHPHPFTFFLPIHHLNYLSSNDTFTHHHFLSPYLPPSSPSSIK